MHYYRNSLSPKFQPFHNENCAVSKMMCHGKPKEPTKVKPKCKSIECNFVGSFKVGDNIGYNIDILRDLVTKNDKECFNKLIVLQAGSILEAALSQIIFRAQHYNKEGVPNIEEKDRLEIEAKNIDKFASVIDVLAKYKVLDALGATIYKDLHKLRQFRNKIHIQSKIKVAGTPLDEEKAFSNNLKDWALHLNLIVLEHLSEKYARPNKVGVACGNLLVPI
jgi:hypothetical protein